MNPAIYNIALDIHKLGTQVALPMVKGDNKRKIVVTLMEDGRPYKIDADCTAVFTAVKPDNNFIYNDCEVDVENNIILYNITTQTTAALGEVRCQIKLLNKSGEMLNSPEFSIVVADTLYNEEPILASSEEFKALTNFLAKLQQKLADGEFKGEKGETGTTNYYDLENKPKINGEILQGDKSLNQLGIASSKTTTAVAEIYAKLSDKPPLTIDAIKALRNRKQYFETIDAAVAYVNGDKSQATTTERSADVMIYWDEDMQEIPNIVLLKDIKLTTGIIFNAEAVLNLGGHKLRLYDESDAKTTPDTFSTVMCEKPFEGNLVIDGRLAGSGIECESINHNVATIRHRGENLTILGGKYRAVSENALGYTVSNTRYTLLELDPNKVYSGNLTMVGCDVYANSLKNQSCGIFVECEAEITNCTVLADSTTGSLSNTGTGTQRTSTGITCYTGSKVKINNCDVYGNNTGVAIKENAQVYVDGGYYKSPTHGGIYFANPNGISYVKNATMSVVQYKGTNDFDQTDVNSCFYIGGGENCSNIIAYIDNCELTKDEALLERGTAFCLRGSSGEQYNTVYISNSRLAAGMTEKIRIDNATHKLYIGSGCNFGISYITSESPPECVISTSDTYIPPTDLVNKACLDAKIGDIGALLDELNAYTQSLIDGGA